MEIQDFHVSGAAAVAQDVVVLARPGQLGASLTDFVAAVVRLPDGADYELVAAHLYARLVTGTVSARLQDDGVNITAVTTPTAGGFVLMSRVAAGTNEVGALAGGSVVRLLVTTGASSTVDDPTAVLVLRPLRYYGKSARPQPT